MLKKRRKPTTPRPLQQRRRQRHRPHRPPSRRRLLLREARLRHGDGDLLRHRLRLGEGQRTIGVAHGDAIGVDADAAVDPMADPAVRAAVERAHFEVLIGFELTADQLRYNATR